MNKKQLHETFASSVQKFSSIEEWLAGLQLQSYEHFFSKYHGLEDLVRLSESDLKKLGVKSSIDRARMMSSLAVMRGKRSRSFRKKNHEKNIQLDKLKAESSMPQSIFHLMFHSNKLLTCPLGLNPVLNSPLLVEMGARPWYHGLITRSQAEQRLEKSGDFLVRNSPAAPGEVILTFKMSSGLIKHLAVQSFHKHKFRHFKFENESFLSVTSLIDHHVVNKKPIISNDSSSIITNPIKPPYFSHRNDHDDDGDDDSDDRHVCKPLNESFVEQMNLSKGRWTGSQPLLSVADPSDTCKSNNVDRCPSMPYVSNKTKFSIKYFNAAAGGDDDGHPDYNAPDDDNNTSANYSDSYNRVDNINNTNSTAIKNMLDSSHVALAKQSKVDESKIERNDINNNISNNNIAISDINNNNNQNIGTILSAAKPSESYSTKQRPPPKNPSIKCIAPPSYKLSHSSSHESSSSSSLSPNSTQSPLISPTPLTSSSASSSSSSVPPKPSRIPTLKMQASSGTVRPVIKIRNLTLYEGIDDDDDNIENNNSNPGAGNGKNRISSSDSTTNKGSRGDIFSPLLPSYFKNIEEYQSNLISPSTKPLDQMVTFKIRQLLLQNNPNLISKHITFIDIELTRLNQFVDTSLGSLSGLELATLLQGQQLRQDIIERHYSMKLFVGATILFSASLEERCDVLAHWLNVAFELKVNVGNIFSFFSVMQAVCSFQVVRQKSVWKMLKKLHPSTFEIFEGKLLTNYKSFLDGSAVSLPYQRDTILPHLLPLVEILEKYVYEGDNVAAYDNAASSAPSAKLSSWEMNQPSYGLDVVLIHLDNTRLITQRVHLYLSATSNFLKSSPHRAACLLDLLHPRTHARYLWGSQGVVVKRFERLSKLDSLLTILSEKYEQ